MIVTPNKVGGERYVCLTSDQSPRAGRCTPVPRLVSAIHMMPESNEEPDVWTEIHMEMTFIPYYYMIYFSFNLYQSFSLLNLIEEMAMFFFSCDKENERQPQSLPVYHKALNIDIFQTVALTRNNEAIAFPIY